MEMDILLNSLRDPAGVPFYPVVFQGLYILTWALHIAFVLLSLGSGFLALVGVKKRAYDANWATFTPHLVQIAKVSVSILIVLGVAPLLFTQVIYDPNWYVTNTLSGRFVAIFIYGLVVAYATWYWFYYAVRKESRFAFLIGLISFVFLVACGIIMHAFAYESIEPTKWMDWYAPGGVVDTSGTTLQVSPVRLAFMVSLAAPATGIILLNYAAYLSKAPDYTKEYIDFVKNLAKKIGVFGLLISAVLFVVWMYQIGRLFDPLALSIVVGVVVLGGMIMSNICSYYTTVVLVVVALLISGLRELIRYDIMSNLGYSIYNYPMNIDWPSVIMFLTTFVGVGFTGVIFLLTLAWRAGRTKGIYEANKDKTVTLLANATIGICIVWACTFLAWGIFAVFKNTL